MLLLSVIIPVFNEAKTIAKVIENVNRVPVEKEIIVVDDNSGDGTVDILKDLKYPNLKIVYHSSNRGKGGAVLTGFSQASAEYVIIQDADFEYSPDYYLKFIELAKQGAGLILGARFTQGYVGSFMHRVGNRLATAIFNLLFHTKLNDSFSCYKLMRRIDMNSLSLKSNSFDIEAEILAKSVKRGIKIVEVPISYHPRSYKDGKKITISDGIWAIMRIFYFRFAD